MSRSNADEGESLEMAKLRPHRGKKQDSGEDWMSWNWASEVRGSIKCILCLNYYL